MTDGRTDGQTGGQMDENDFIGHCLTNIKRPKSEGSSVDDQSDCFGNKISTVLCLLSLASRTGQVPPPTTIAKSQEDCRLLFFENNKCEI